MHKFLTDHPRLWIAIASGSMLFPALPATWSLLSRILVCWNCGVSLFLVLIFTWMAGLTADAIRSRYTEEDESAPIILVVVVLGALLSLVAIVEPLATLRHVAGVERYAHLALAALTLANSWILVPTMFATHYADAFYSAAEPDRPLRFPDTPLPVFWDFAYFSFTIAAACQTADVTTLTADIRRTVLAHTLVAFLFNVSILGFAINVTAGLIGA